MRKTFSTQQRFDSRGVRGVQLNCDCRDEIIPILKALQHIYSQAKTRDAILALVADDVNRESRDDVGREGMDYWQILVLAAVRLGCNLNYDKLQDLAEQHRNLRHIMGIGDWCDATDFGWRRIRDNVCLLQPTTIEKISHLIIETGHGIAPEAAKHTRADSFVVETNIHWPTESTLIRDGVRKIIELCVLIASSMKSTGWRQAVHLLKRVKKHARNAERIASRKGPRYEERLRVEYQHLLKLSGRITHRAQEILRAAKADSELSRSSLTQELQEFLERTEQVRGTARRRIIKGETVPNSEKLFSMFETHTQLFKRGKAGEPIQFGRLVLVFEDAVGFITHSYVLGREEQDCDVVVAQTRIVQERLKGAIEAASFDRGFHTPENQEELAKIVTTTCLLKRGAKQSKQQADTATIEFRQARQRHPGVESAIGALQSGNGLERCRDRTELGFERYVTLGILGRNLHVLGRLIIAREFCTSEAARSKRQCCAA